MGLCVSSDATADGAATARVVLPSGELREYSQPIMVTQALDEVGHGEKGWFLCDADVMGFEGSVVAVARSEELRPGQIYFVLPAEMLRRRLTIEEVAALAVKASAALVKAATASSTSSRRRRGSVAPLVFTPSDEDYTSDTVSATFAAKPVAARKRVVAYRGGRSPPRFSPDLTAIQPSRRPSRRTTHQAGVTIQPENKHLASSRLVSLVFRSTSPPLELDPTANGRGDRRGKINAGWCL